MLSGQDPAEQRFLAVVLDGSRGWSAALGLITASTRLEAEEQVPVPLNGLLGQIVERFIA
jgi:hypothetical protein